MDKSQKFQIAKIFFIAALLLIAPLLSTSMRLPYLYFLTNFLIIALGAEAGLLSFLSRPEEEKRSSAAVAPKSIVLPAVAEEASPAKVGAANSSVGDNGLPECIQRKAKVIEKSASEKIVKVVKVHNVKKCPSTPGLFFIGGGDIEAKEIKEEVEEGEQADGLSGQELFTKAETFIGNFYKQLKIQREESWKRIHGYYHKAF